MHTCMDGWNGWMEWMDKSHSPMLYCLPENYPFPNHGTDIIIIDCTRQGEGPIPPLYERLLFIFSLIFNTFSSNNLIIVCGSSGERKEISLCSV